MSVEESPTNVAASPQMIVDSPLVLATIAVSFLTGFLLSRWHYTRSTRRAETPVENAPSIHSTDAPDDSDSEDDSLLSSFTGEPLKMVLVVNDSLKMGKGKIAAQCCHAALGAYLRAKPADLAIWKALGQTKVCVKAESTDDLFAVEAAAKANKLPCYLVRDAGRTQIQAGSVTVCGVGPARISVVDQITGAFKLL